MIEKKRLWGVPFDVKISSSNSLVQYDFIQDGILQYRRKTLNYHYFFKKMKKSQSQGLEPWGFTKGVRVRHAILCDPHLSKARC